MMEKTVHPSSMNPPLPSSRAGHQQQHQHSWMVLLTWPTTSPNGSFNHGFPPTETKDLFRVSLASPKKLEGLGEK